MGHYLAPSGLIIFASRKSVNGPDEVLNLNCYVPSYAELKPEQLDALWAKNALAIVPWGALEWHGSHLPLGLDGLIAEWFAQKLADVTDSVLLPSVWLPMTTLPHRHSQQVQTATFRLILDDMLHGLYTSGARRICLITGHYAQGHLMEMSEAALRAMEDHTDLLVFAGSPLEPLAQPELLDHAGHFETSQLLAIRPDLVELDKSAKKGPQSKAILGEDPNLGTVEEGTALLKEGLRAWHKWIKSSDSDSLANHYRGVFDQHEAYVEAYYRGSWEDAILQWWAEQSRTVT